MSRADRNPRPPGRGGRQYLIRLDVDEMAQIYLMRNLLEPEPIKTIRWPTATEMQQLRETARVSEEALARRDPVTCLDLERTIDHQIYDLSRLKIVVAKSSGSGARQSLPIPDLRQTAPELQRGRRLPPAPPRAPLRRPGSAEP